MTDGSAALRTAEKFREYIESPILNDINITYSGFDVYEIEPLHLPTLFAKRPIVVFGKWRGMPTGSINISGKSGNNDYVQEIQISDIERTESNAAISYLWAQKKVERLTDYGINLNKNDVKNEVTAIGLKYNMMTEYTSFVAVLERIRNDGEKSIDVTQPAPMPFRVSDFAVAEASPLPVEPYPIALAPRTGDNILLICCLVAVLVLIGSSALIKKYRYNQTKK